MNMRKSLVFIWLLALLIVMGVSGALYRSHTKELLADDQNFHENTELTNLVRACQVHFKIQVQEWKDVLLRGHNPADRKKYWEQFLKEESETERLAAELAWKLDSYPILRREAERFLVEHRGLRGRYREALALFDQGGADAHIRADRQVRGLDRDPTELLERLVGQVTLVLSEEHQSFSDEAWQQHQHFAYLTLLAFGAFSVLVYLFMRRTIFIPLGYATQVARLLGRGDYFTKVENHWRGEVGALLHAMSQMQNRILTDTEEMARQNEELRLATQQAQLADTAKSQFLSTMSHELRTPLNGILGAQQVLELGELDTEQRDMVTIIGDSARHLDGLVANILDFTVLNSSHSARTNSEFEAVQVLKRCAETFTEAAQKKGLKLIIVGDPSPLVSSDETLLVKLTTLLVENAVKFTQKGSITVTVQCEQSSADVANLKLSVADTGIGFPAEQLQSLTETFTQADNSATRGYGGIGLGLAMCHRIVRMLGGTLDATSTPGVGSEFVANIPLSVKSHAV